MNKNNSSFVYYKKYKNFEKDKAELSKNALVFVEDRKSIWTHGVEYGGSGMTIEQSSAGTWTFKDNSGTVLATISTLSLTEEDVNRLIASGITITIDSELSDTSTNAIQNRTVKAALDTKLNRESYVVDDKLNAESINPIQNKAVKAAIDAIKIPSLTGYMKKADADDTYATKDMVNAISHVDTTGLVTTTDLNAYYTSEYVAATYATKEQLAAKADSSALSNYATAASLLDKVDSSTLNIKETEIKSWVEAKNYLTEHQSLENYATKADLAAIDTSVFLLVDELPAQNINTNKIYIYDGSQYRYVSDGQGGGEWTIIGEANTEVDLTPYLRSDTAASTYATKVQLEDYALDSALDDYVPILSVYYPAGPIPYTPEGQEGYEEAIKLIDTTLDVSSVNPIQNKAVAEALAEKASASTVASTYATKQALTDLQIIASNTYATKTALSTGLAEKQDTLTAGTGISIQNGVISTTLDTNLYIVVDELPLIDIDPNKIYILETRNTDGTYSYVEYRYRQQPNDD